MRRAIVSLIVFSAALPAQNPPTMFPPVRGTRALVGGANNFEVEAGWRMIEQGGNAIDSGVAAVLAASVSELSRFGIGGELPIIVKIANKAPVVICGVGRAPALATVQYYTQRAAEPWEDAAAKPPIPSDGIRAAITPGAFDAVVLALEKYGTKSFSSVARPAIELAERGFPMPEEFGHMLVGYRQILSLWPASDRFFYPQGAPTPVGELFREPDYARTLRSLAAVESKTSGSRAHRLEAVRAAFSHGAIARRIAAFSDQNGGLLRYADLARSHASIEPPVSGTYRGYTIYKPGFWTQGPVMIETLNILEGFDLKAMGHNSPAYLHTVIEAVKLAFADRDAYYGDPAFSRIPEATLLSKDYAAARRTLIDPAHASLESRPGQIPGVAVPAMPSSRAAGAANDTTSIDVVDAAGDAFNATPSGAWLPSVIAGSTGIPLSTRLQSFVLTPGHANQLAPGKRPRVTLSPTLVMKDGKLAFIMSTPGGDNQDQALLQVLLNMVEFGMLPQEAVEAPRFESAHLYSSFGGHTFSPAKLALESRIPSATAQALAALGHRVTVLGPWSNSSAPVVIEAHGAVLSGGADIRRARYLFGR